jgi:hypothetical protein
VSCFTSSQQALFDRFGQDRLRNDLETAHEDLLKRRLEVIEYGDPGQITPPQRATANCRLLQQAALHRAERIVASVGAMLEANNTYGLALLVRGHYETTGVLGYFCHRLESLAGGNISFETFEWNLADAVMGAKHELFAHARPPLNVLTCIEKADRYLEKHFTRSKRGVLLDSYNWLSELAHPNYLSNRSAFRPTRSTTGLFFDTGLR